MDSEVSTPGVDLKIKPTSEANARVNEPIKIKSPDYIIPPNERQRSLDILSKFAKSVRAGRSEPGALQKYVDNLKANNFPTDQIAVILESSGIQVRLTDQDNDLRTAVEQIQTEISPLIQRLQQVFPDQPGGDGRLGKEVPISQDDLSLIRRAIESSIKLLNTKPGMAKLNAFIASMLPNKGFQSAHAWGTLVKEDTSITEPLYENIDNQPRIRLPSPLYRNWSAANGLNGAALMLGLTGSAGSFEGRSSAGLWKSLETGIQTALS